jgi:hypothetical protein
MTRIWAAGRADRFGVADHQEAGTHLVVMKEFLATIASGPTDSGASPPAVLRWMT